MYKIQLTGKKISEQDNRFINKIFVERDELREKLKTKEAEVLEILRKNAELQACLDRMNKTKFFTLEIPDGGTELVSIYDPCVDQMTIITFSDEKHTIVIRKATKA